MSAGGLSGMELRALRAAAAWYARLCSGHVTPEDRLRWQRWRDVHPAHGAAWQRIEAMQRQLGSVPGALAAPALQAAAQTGLAQVSRRGVLRGTLAVLGASGLAWHGWRQPAAREWRLAMLADISTATGEQRRLILPDGSRLVLNTDSAVDLAYDEAQRRLLLRRGEIFIGTVADPHLAIGYGARPFLVDTPHGRIRALGTRFLVRSDHAGTLVTVLEKAVEVRSGQQRPMLVQAEQQLRIGADGAMQGPTPAAFGAGAWQNDSLLVDNMPLSRLLAELGRYRRGVLQCDPRVADLRISGNFPLADSDRALQVLANGFPLHIVMHTRFWVRVLPA